MQIEKIKAFCNNCGNERHLEASDERSVTCVCGFEMNILKYNVFKREKGAGVEKPKKKVVRVKEVVTKTTKPATNRANLVAKVKNVLVNKKKGDKHGKKNRSKNL